jgi:hypothetical protein
VSQRPKALRLADAIDPLIRQNLDNLTCSAAADELRRMHALNQEWEQKAATWLASPEAAKRLKGYRELAHQTVEALNQRDELLAALKAFVKSLADQDDEGLIEHAQQMIDARAVIAKVEGGPA